MDANSVNQIINNVAEKTGMAARELGPLAEKAVAEYGMQQAVYAAGAGVLALVAAGMAAFFFRASWETRDRTDDFSSVCLFGGAVMLGAFAGAVISAICDLGDSMAPTYECLKQLLN